MDFIELATILDDENYETVAPERLGGKNELIPKLVELSTRKSQIVGHYGIQGLCYVNTTEAQAALFPILNDADRPISLRMEGVSCALEMDKHEELLDCVAKSKDPLVRLGYAWGLTDTQSFLKDREDITRRIVDLLDDENWAVVKHVTSHIARHPRKKWSEAIPKLQENIKSKRWGETLWQEVYTVTARVLMRLGVRPGFFKKQGFLEGEMYD